MPDNYIYSNTDENKFWLQLMGDDARIILDALSPDQTEETQEARAVIKKADELLGRARDYLTPEQLMGLNREAYATTAEVRHFLLNILRKQVMQNFLIALKPAVINNMVSFAEEYMYLLNAFINNRQPEFDSTENDIFWLPFFTNVARNIADSSGTYQADIRQKANDFARIFQDLNTSAQELQGIYRIGTTTFPIADQYRKDVIRALQDFSKFLVELLSLVQQNRMPGTLSPIYLDRSYRILCYYLTQLTTLAKMAKPDCDPLRPRVSESQYMRM